MEERLRYLFKKYLDNSCTYEEMEEFFAVIRNSQADEALRLLIRNTHQDLNENSDLSTHVNEKGRLFVSEPQLPKQEEKIYKQPRTKWRARISIAAVVILMAGAIALIQQRIRKENHQAGPIASLTKKSTDRSESKYIVLEDGTEVWLNAASSLQFPDQFDPAKREVVLSGEAFFDVRHADKTPFIIHTGTISTTVLGTAFNIKAYPGEKAVTVSVSRGKVRVDKSDGWTATLTKGQQLKVEEKSKEVVEKIIPTGDVAAWQQGTIVYDDETLSDIISDMQRVYNVDIRIKSTTLEEQRISTSFKKDIGVYQALQVLCKLTDAELSQDNGIYFIK